MNNKAILMSVQPKWVMKILNGNKTIEVRKKFPKDYVGWVYIYCTKNGTDINGFPTELVDYRGCAIYNRFQLMYKGHKLTTDDNKPRLNGKVVARFWCDKVEEIKVYNVIEVNIYKTDEICAMDLCKKSCLTQASFERYLGNKNGYAIHISRLEVFDTPKELKDFRHTCKAEYRGYNRWQPCSKECKNCICNQLDDEGYSQCFSRLTKAPESWYYIEDK